MRPHALPRAGRLLLKREFRAVFDHGRSRADDVFIVYARPRDGPGPSRLGLVVGRKFGGAVARNALKRRVRETFRLARDRLPTGHDYVVLPATPGDIPDARRADHFGSLIARAIERGVRGTEAAVQAMAWLQGIQFANCQIAAVSTALQAKAAFALPGGVGIINGIMLSATAIMMEHNAVQLYQQQRQTAQLKASIQNITRMTDSWS